MYSQGVVLLDKPNKNSIWPAYSLQKITWSSSNVENIKIEVSLDSGRNWVTMLESYPASAGFYEWEVPNYISDSCYIKISDVLNPSSSSTNFKNNPFKIPAPVIILDSLETIYYSKQVLPISWVASGIKKVNIYLSYDNKLNFIKIGSNISANSLSLNHILRDTIAENCYIVIADTANIAVNDTSILSFKILNSIAGRSSKYHGGPFDGHSSKNNLVKKLNLVYPNKYDSLIGGQKLPIKWDVNNIENIDILYSNDSNKTWKIIDSNISALANQFEWKIPNIPTNYGRLMIRDTKDTVIKDYSDTAFMIRKRSLIIKSPTDSLFYNTVFPIYWSSIGVDKIRIIINGALIADSLNAINESYNWIVPNSVSNNFFIKIIDITDSSIVDSLTINKGLQLPNKSLFKFKGGPHDGHSYKSNKKSSIAIIYPNGGERVAKASKMEIKWRSSEIDYINLNYSLDSGISWQIADSNIVANLGNYTWTLPNSVSEKMMIKLTYTSDTSVFAYSSGLFSTLEKEIHLQLDKTNWSSNKLNQIKWTTFGIDSLKISYKEKDSTNWNTINKSISTNAEVINWLTPIINSDSIILKIIDLSDSVVYHKDSLFIKKLNGTNSLLNSKYKGGKFDGHSYKSNVNKIIINKPMANEILISGKPYNLNWDIINLNDTVLLQYSIDSGKSWINIERVPALLGSYEWTIPVSNNTNTNTNSEKTKSILSTSNINSDICLIRVLDIKAGNEIVGMSKKPFSIKPSTYTTKAEIKLPVIDNINWDNKTIYKKLLGTTNSSNTIKYFVLSGKYATISNDTLIIQGPGKVAIGGYDPGNTNFAKSDTVTVEFCINPAKPVFDIYNKTICMGDSITISAPSGYTKYLWSNNDTTRAVVLKYPSQIQVQVFTDNCTSILSDTISILVDNVAALKVTNISNCQNENPGIITIPKSSGYSLLWYTNSENSSIASTVTPTYSTSSIGSTNLYVAQKNDTTSCVGPKAKISISIYPIPVTPIITRDLNNQLISSALYGNVWYKDGALLTDTSQNIKPSSNGNYSVKTIQNNCVSNISTSYNYLITDILVLSQNQFIRIAPNPFIEKFTIDYSLIGCNQINLEVYDMNTGKILKNIANIYAGTTIQLDGLVKGYYIFSFYSKDGKHNYKFKMLKL